MNRLRTAWQVTLFGARQAWDDNVALKSAALAFVTILSLVPLLAAFSFIGARLFDQYEQRVLEVLVSVLPYSEATLVSRIDDFLAQAESIRELGFVGFLIISLTAFGTIEETLNQIWRVRARRALRVRLLSITLVLFWGPILMGLVFSFLLLLRTRPGLDVLFQESLLVQITPFAISALGLTMLYWLVPHTRVRFAAAATGGVTGALLLEVLRRGFGQSILLTRHYGWVVYGSFALVFFFMLSIQLAWLIVLFGCEIAYVRQNLATLLAERPTARRYAAPWLGLAVLVALTRRLTGGHPHTLRSELATELGLTAPTFDIVIEPLLEQGLVELVESDDGEGFLLAADPHELAAHQVLSAYDGEPSELFGALDPTMSQRLEETLARVRAGRIDRLGSLCLSDLAEELPAETS